MGICGGKPEETVGGGGSGGGGGGGDQGPAGDHAPIAPSFPMEHKVLMEILGDAFIKKCKSYGIKVNESKYKDFLALAPDAGPYPQGVYDGKMAELHGKVCGTREQCEMMASDDTIDQMSAMFK